MCNPLSHIEHPPHYKLLITNHNIIPTGSQGISQVNHHKYEGGLCGSGGLYLGVPRVTPSSIQARGSDTEGCEFSVVNMYENRNEQRFPAFPGYTPTHINSSLRTHLSTDSITYMFLYKERARPCEAWIGAWICYDFCVLPPI